ncbi:MAG: 50S ribosomal protein L21 [Acidimicrobiia bacterium]|nr:50S ribosomal protein L21 [Acidimicrobiia bacterium]
MYAIIRAGGKQAKVKSGDVINVERLATDGDVEFEPVLIVDEDGTAHSERGLLEGSSVTAKVIGETSGPKIRIFKYKNKTGYRRRQGHRQHYTSVEITGITLPAGAKVATPKEEE